MIASLAGEGVHANDDVNMGQSSNDVFPSAVHLAALDEIVNDLVPALDTASVPATLNPAIMTGLLRKQLGFKGLLITDAMDMNGVLSRVTSGPSAAGYRPAF